MAFQLLAEGRYHGKIVKQDVYSTKGEDGGTGYVGLDGVFTHKDDEFGKQVELASPVRRRLSLWLNEKNVKRVHGDLRFLGFFDNNPEGDISRINPFHPEYISLVGKEISVNVSHSQDKNGKDQEAIFLDRAIKALGKESKAEVLSKIADLFKAYQAEVQEKKGVKAEPKPDNPKELEDNYDNQDGRLTGDETPF